MNHIADRTNVPTTEQPTASSTHPRRKPRIVRHRRHLGYEQKIPAPHAVRQRRLRHELERQVWRTENRWFTQLDFDHRQMVRMLLEQMKHAGRSEYQGYLKLILMDTWVYTNSPACVESIVDHLWKGGALVLGSSYCFSINQSAALPNTIPGAVPWRSFLGEVPTEIPWVSKWIAECRAAEARLAALDQPPSPAEL